MKPTRAQLHKAKKKLKSLLKLKRPDATIRSYKGVSVVVDFWEFLPDLKLPLDIDGVTISYRVVESEAPRRCGC